MPEYDSEFLDWVEGQEDGPRYCRNPDCGGRLVNDWEGDPDVIGGTRDLLTCRECGESFVDDDTPLAATEKLFDWSRKNGLLPTDTPTPTEPTNDPAST